VAHRLRAAPVVALTLALAAPALRAQCPDGSPPPCAGARARPAARVTPPAAAERGRRFLVLPFRNVTRGAEQEWLVEGSTAILGEAMGRWQGVSVVSDERLYPALRRAGITPGTVADAPRVRRVAEETGGWTAVTGDVYAIAGKVRVSARGYDVVTGQEVVRAASEVLASADVRLAYDTVGTRLLRAAGLDSGAVDVGDATTRSLDAFRAYTRGLAHQRRAELRSAQEAFREAVRLDSAFALGWARLAEVTLGLDPTSVFNPASPAAGYLARAVALSARLPNRNRQLVLASDANLRVQFAEARRLLLSLLAADSNDVDALLQMAGLEVSDMVLVDVPGGQRPRGSAQTAVRLAQRAVELDPSRHSVYTLLAGLYARAGMPGREGMAFGIDRAPASLAEYLQLAQQPAHMRIYGAVFSDTLGLVPAESLAAIPKETLESSRTRARAIARDWAQRWVAVAPGEATGRQLYSELLGIDGMYPEALRELTVAESLGVQLPNWAPRARRLLLLAKAGRLAEADRIADSLTATGFFADPNIVQGNMDAMAWAFLLALRSGRAAQAGTLLDQLSNLFRLATGRAQPMSAFVLLQGNNNPEGEPKIPRQLRAEVLDSLLRHVTAVAADERVGPWMAFQLAGLARLAGQTEARAPELLRAAESLAAAGRTALAFQLALNAIEADSATIMPRAEALAWYRSAAEALFGARAATQSRFHPASATVGAERAVFEWRVDDTAPFAWNRAESEHGGAEYRWSIDLEMTGRYYVLSASSDSPYPGAAPGSGTLSDLLSPTLSRTVSTGALGANGVPTDDTDLQGVALRTEAAPGVLRMVVTDRGVLDALRQARPAQARFRFRPCARPVGGVAQCVDERVTVGYP
jgi:TolB-like protein